MDDFNTATRTLSLDDFKALKVLKPLTEDEEMEAIQNAYAQAAACSILSHPQHLRRSAESK